MISWLDLVIIFALIFFGLEGLGRSFLGEVLNFLSFLLALFLSLKFYGLLSRILEQNFGWPHSIDNILAFLTVWCLVESVNFLLMHLLFHPSPRLLIIDQKLKPLSFIPAFCRGVVFVAIVLVVIGIFPLQPQLKLAVNDSKIGSLILRQTISLETPLKNVFGDLSHDSLNFLTVEPRTSEHVNLGFKLNNFKERMDLEGQMIDLVNQERISRGLSGLSYNSKLQQIALRHSDDMFKRGYFSHYSPEGETVAHRAEKANFDYLVIGENLAYAPSLDLAHNGLMNSPGHRANILSPDFHRIGIGVDDGGVYGLMITQVFSN